MKHLSSISAFFVGAILLALVALIAIYTRLESFDVALAVQRGATDSAMVALNYLGCALGILLVRYGIRSKVALDGF